MRHLQLLCFMLLLCGATLSMQGQAPATVEIKVKPNAPHLAFRYQIQEGQTAKVDWGDGQVDELTSERATLKVIKHTFDYPDGVPDGAIVKIESEHLIALEEPKASDGLSYIIGWGKIEAPLLTSFAFVKSRISDMFYSTDVDFSKCPNLRVLKLHDVHSFTLPSPSLIEELEVRGAWNGYEPAFYLGDKLDLTQCTKLKKLTLTLQKEIQAVDITGCNKLQELYVQNSPKLRQLIGIKDLSGSLKKCKLEENALTFDQLPTWTEDLLEQKTRYEQSRKIYLPEGAVRDNVVDLSFMHQITDATGKQHKTMIAAVLVGDLPMDATHYELQEDGKLVFKKEAFVRREGDQQINLATLDVRIAPTNDYYPNYGTNEYDPTFEATLTNPFLHTVKEYTVYYVAGDHGMVNAHIIDNQSTELLSGTKVSSGTKVHFVAKPDTHYQVDQWLVNNQPVAATGSENKELTLPILEETTVQVTFKKKVEYFTVTFTAEGGGSITAVRDVDQTVIQSGGAVLRGTSVTFTATPNEGYEVKKWLVNGMSSPVVTTTLRQTVQSNLEVHIVFVPGERKVTYSCNSEGGELYAVQGQKQTKFLSGETLPVGVELLFTAKPKSGWEVKSWTIDGKLLEGSKDLLEYRLKLTHELTISVLFAKYGATEEAVKQVPVITFDGNMLYIRGCESSETVSLFDPAGRCLYKGPVGVGLLDISPIASETKLIVRIGDISQIVIR